MLKIYITHVVAAIFIFSSQRIYSKDTEVLVRVSYGMKLKSGHMRFNGKQWVPSKKSKVVGGIALKIKLDGHIKKFSTNIRRIRVRGKTVKYLCANGRSFTLDRYTKPHPVIPHSFKRGKVHLKKLVRAYQRSKTDRLAWRIWMQVDKRPK